VVDQEPDGDEGGDREPPGDEHPDGVAASRL
jgi:hypothetical protein